MLPLAALAALSAGEECWYACADKAGYYGGECSSDFCAEGELCCRDDTPYSPFAMEATDAGCGVLGCEGRHCCTEVASASIAHEGERCSAQCVDERGALDPECRSGFCGTGGFCCLRLDQNPGSVNCGDAGCEGHHCCVAVVGGAAPVFHEAVQDCWAPCGFGVDAEGQGRQGGECPTRFCGAGLCCRADPSHPFDDEACGESGCWGYHCCVGAGSVARGIPPPLSVDQSIFGSVAAAVGAVLLILCLLCMARGGRAPAIRGKDEAAARQAADSLLKGDDAERSSPPPAPTSLTLPASRAATARAAPPPGPPSTPAPPSPSVASGRFTFLTRSSSSGRPGRQTSAGHRRIAFPAVATPNHDSPTRDAPPSATSRNVGRDAPPSAASRVLRDDSPSSVTSRGGEGERPPSVASRGGLRTSGRSDSAGSPWKTFFNNFSYRGAEEPDWLRRAGTEVMGGAGASSKA
jgi:hypothetical protein